MNPFNLEKAVKGDPVVTAKGYRVKISGYNESAKPMGRVVGWIYWDEQSPEACAWSCNGECAGTDEKNLFMAPNKKEGWVVLNHNKNDIRQRIHQGSVYAGQVYSTLEDANRCSGNSEGTYPVAKIEWEE